MSKILVNVDYIALSQWIAYGRHELKTKDGETVTNYLERVRNQTETVYKKIEDILDGGIDKDVLKQFKT